MNRKIQRWPSEREGDLAVALHSSFGKRDHSMILQVMSPAKGGSRSLLKQMSLMWEDKDCLAKVQR